MLYGGKRYFIYKNTSFSHPHTCVLSSTKTCVQVACPAFGHLEGDLVNQVEKVVWSTFLVVKKCTKDSEY